VTALTPNIHAQMSRGTERTAPADDGVCKVLDHPAAKLTPTRFTVIIQFYKKIYMALIKKRTTHLITAVSLTRMT